MSFFSRWFRSSDPTEEVLKAFNQRRWADVLSLSSSLEGSLTEPDQLKLQEVIVLAADHLARLNLDEGIACICSQDVGRGMEHFELARQLARNEELRSSIEAELRKVGVGFSKLAEEKIVNPSKNSCSSACCGSPGGVASVLVETSELDETAQFDLILTAYPPDIRPRYLELAAPMRNAILLSHEGKTDEALASFSAIPDRERNEIFFYEFGALLGRVNRYNDAVAALHKALAQNPRQLLSVVLLIDLHVANGNYDAAESLLGQMLSVECMPDYCHARYAVIWQARGNPEKAFDHATEALRLGHNDPELMVFVAKILEDNGRFNEAEEVLNAIPSGKGCSGEANVELAEFWLRHNKKLHQALEMFKKAGKSDPSNPIWGYHIARVYLALGWKKEANQILETFAKSDVINSSLRENAINLLRNSS